MSEQVPESLELHGDLASASVFTQILDFLAPEKDESETGSNAAPDAGVGSGGAGQPAAGEGAGAAAAATGAPASGVESSGSAEQSTDGGGQEAAADSEGIDVAVVLPVFGEMSTAFEKAQLEILQQNALTEVQEEYGKYFETLRMHPRALVGKEVPSLRGDGSMDRLRDSADAKEWQDAIKDQLVREIDSRVATRQQDLQAEFEIVHESIQLFQNNPDLVPGTKQFNQALADAFADAAKEYELRQDGKLIGYSVPVQPIINALRRATPAAPAAPVAPAEPKQTPPRNELGQWTGPQGGIISKAGSSGAADSDDAASVLGAFMRQNGFTV